MSNESEMWPFASKNETLEKLKDLEKSVLEIKDVSQSQKNTFERQLKEIDKSLKEMKDPGNEKLEKYGKVIKSITSATAAIPKLSTGDPLQVTQGILDTVAAFAPLGGPVGEIVGLLASLVSGILGLFGSGGPDPMNVILQEIKKMFEQYQRQEIMEKIHGTFEVLRHVHATMNGLEESGKFTKEDFMTLQTTVLDTIGVDCLGQVASFMNNELKNVEKVEEAEILLGIVRSYCQLSLVRLILLYQKYSLCMKMKQEGTALATKRNIDVDRGEERRNDLKAFYFPPNYDEALTASVLMQSDEPIIKSYMEVVGVPSPPYPSPEEQMVVSQAYQDEPVKITFTKVPNSIYWKISGKWRVCRYNLINDMEYLGEDDDLRVALILTQDNKCLLSPRGRPGSFLCMNFLPKILAIGYRLSSCNMLFYQFRKGDPQNTAADFGFWKINVMFEGKRVHPSEGIQPRELGGCPIL